MIYLQLRPVLNGWDVADKAFNTNQSINQSSAKILKSTAKILKSNVRRRGSQNYFVVEFQANRWADITGLEEIKIAASDTLLLFRMRIIFNTDLSYLLTYLSENQKLIENQGQPVFSFSLGRGFRRSPFWCHVQCSLSGIRPYSLYLTFKYKPESISLRTP